MGTAFLGKRLYIASSEYGLIIEYLEEGIELSISGGGRFGKERITGSDLIRFAGACFSAGYGVDGFEKEVIGRLYIDRDRIRVIVQGSLEDRVFIKVRPEHFLEASYLCITKYYPSSAELVVSQYSLGYNLSQAGVSLSLKTKDTQGEIFIEKEKASLLIGLIEASFVGRSIGSARIVSERDGKSLYVEEIIEPKEDPKKPVVDYLAHKGGKSEVSKPLHEWIVDLKELAKEAGRSPSGVLRSFLRKHSIAYDRKILFSLVDRKGRHAVRLPMHFAKGLALILSRWLYVSSV